ncbi:MAG TPA: GAF domain-containing protein [Gemmatimonadaceae bacterium]|nr:GAF domain-containing protein [Gemmatimonadaceae bacterium]
MPPRTLASLAHALGAASDLDAALVALGEALAEVDRSAHLCLLGFDARRQLLREKLSPNGGHVVRARVDTTFDHLPERLRAQVTAGGQFADVGDESDEYARLLSLDISSPEEGLLALRGISTDGHLSAVVALHEPRRFFGTRVMERFAPYVALFELAYARFAEREARNEAVRTLEDVTQRVHAEYVKHLAALEAELATARTTPASTSPVVAPERLLALESEVARAREEARRATRRADAVEGQVTAAVAQLEQAHVELHRRSEALRQRTRTLYLIDRVLSLDATTADPRQLADGLLALVGDDMQAQRCSLMLRVPETRDLYIAAAKGLAPEVMEGQRTPIGVGVAGKVAASRQPLLVTDVAQARGHPLIGDEYFTTGSFISFPLVYHGELVGVVNLTNRAQRGVFVEEDVERVRLLALVISLIASHAALPERLLVTIGVR